MKRVVIKLLAYVSVIATVFAITILLMGYMLGRTGETAERSMETADITDIADSGGFVVKIHNGKIAVFTEDFQTEPAVITELETALLRNVDRELLEQGVALSTYEEVLHLIEDFGP